MSENGGMSRGEPAPSEEEWVTFTQDRAVALLTLSRPAALNAITRGMRQRWAELLPTISRDIMTYIVLLGSSSPKAFSAGGDLKELVSLLRLDPALARQSFREEYALNWTLDCFSKPTVALLDGIVIGGGNGLTMFATHRVAGENYRFSMPETKIGFFPDDGLAYFFGRMPSNIGLYLGLTGRSIDRTDALFLGLVTHSIDRQHFDKITDTLADAWPVDPLLDGLHHDPGDSALRRLAPTIERCFSGSSVGEILHRLSAEREEKAWSEGVAEDLKQRSPLALEVTLRHIRMARAMDLRQTLQVDYRLACRMLEHPDFIEGVTTVLFERDRKPVWRPGHIADVTTAMVDDCFAPMGSEELVLPTRQEMQATRI